MMGWLPAVKVVAILKLPVAVAVPVAPEIVVPLSERAIVAYASADPVMTTAVVFVMRSVVRLPVSVAVERPMPVGAIGATLSMVKPGRRVPTKALPARSVAFTVAVTGPLPAGMVIVEVKVPVPALAV